MPKEIIDMEYEAFKRFLAWACENGSRPVGALPESHPLYVLAKFEGKAAHAKLKNGLRETVNDVLTKFAFWPAEQVKEADEALQKLGGPTLSEMRMMFDNDLSRIEKRGKLQTEEECFLVRNALEMPMIQADSRRAKKLLGMLSEYETSD